MKLLRENEIESPYNLKEMLWFIIPGATLLLSIFLFEFWFAGHIRRVDVYNAFDSLQVYEKLRDDTSNASLKISDDSMFVIKNLHPTKEEADSLKKRQDSIRIVNKMRSDTIKAIQDTIQSLQKKLFGGLHTPVFTALLLTYVGEKVNRNNWILSTLYLLIIISICYILGHITYMIGTFVYERGMIMKGYGYPYIKLLKLSETKTKDSPKEDVITVIEERANHSFYKGIYFWTAVIFIGSYIFYCWWGIDNFKVYKYAIILVIVFYLMPCRFKFILDNIIEREKENIEEKEKQKEKEKVKKKDNVQKNTIEENAVATSGENLIHYANSPSVPSFKAKIKLFFKSRPRIGGFLFWPICVSILLYLISILGVTQNNCLLYCLPFCQGSQTEFYIALWFYLLLGFLLFEMSLKYLVIQRKYLLSFATKLIRMDSDFLSIDFPNGTRFEVAKSFCQILYIKIYNRLGNEIDKFSKNYFHTQDSFDQNFISNYATLFKSVYGKTYTYLKRHNYWLAKFFIMENSTNLNQQVSFWENNYRFSKSLSAAFLIASVYCSYTFLYQYQKMQSILGDINNHHILIRNYLENIQYAISVLANIPVFYFITTTLVVQYYMYIYDNRYHRMILRAFSSLVSSKNYNEHIKNLKKKPETD